MKKNNQAIVVISIIAMIFSFSSCDWSGKDKKEETVIVSGIVTDENNYPLSGVEVSLGDETVVTTETGTFVLDEYEKEYDDAIVSFKKTGFYSTTGRVEKLEEVNQIQVSMIKSGFVSNYVSNGTGFSNQNGGKLRLSDGSEIEFESGSLESSSGFTSIGMTLITPEQYMFSSLVPGQDLKAEYDGKEYQLMAYGLYFIEIYDTNSKASASITSPATLKTAIPAADVNYMPDEMELWSFNEDKGVWQFEGTAAKEGSFYVGEVGHFSAWLIGMSTDKTATVKGSVIDRSGRGINGQIVRVSQTSAVTDKDGNYKVVVPAAQEFVVGMKYKGFEIKMDAGPLNAGEVLEMDLSVPAMTIVTGEIKNCNDEPIGGQATLTWGDPDFSTQFVENGKFELSIPSVVKDITLTIQVGDSISKKQISNLDKKSDIDAGEFTICVEDEDDAGDIEEEKEKEKVKTPKVSTVNIAGKWNFFERSDGQNPFNYYYILVNADGTYEDFYQPRGDTYVGGTKGNWKKEGSKYLFWDSSNSSETFTLNGNVLSRTTESGLVFKFRK
jgi:hypothetical protein